MTEEAETPAPEPTPEPEPTPPPPEPTQLPFDGDEESRRKVFEESSKGRPPE